ncbi:hypothetical protein C8J56DRAFT_1027554 [Mycena floridula]|nr:hypothetical protein C8J56DRAFT_1027554 [Mycena floridula]
MLLSWPVLDELTLKRDCDKIAITETSLTYSLIWHANSIWDVVQLVRPASFHLTQFKDFGRRGCCSVLRTVRKFGTGWTVALKRKPQAIRKRFERKLRELDGRINMLSPAFRTDRSCISVAVKTVGTVLVCTAEPFCGQTFCYIIIAKKQQHVLGAWNNSGTTMEQQRTTLDNPERHKATTPDADTDQRRPILLSNLNANKDDICSAAVPAHIRADLSPLLLETGKCLPGSAPFRVDDLLTVCTSKEYSELTEPLNIHSLSNNLKVLFRVQQLWIMDQEPSRIGPATLETVADWLITSSETKTMQERFGIKEEELKW